MCPYLNFSKDLFSTVAYLAFLPFRLLVRILALLAGDYFVRFRVFDFSLSRLISIIMRNTLRSRNEAHHDI